MGEGDLIITAISSLHGEMTRGFDRIYDEIGAVCTRVQSLELDRTAREAAEKVKKDAACVAEKLEAREEAKRIDWGKVRQGAVLAACVSMTLGGLMLLWAGVKFLSLNLDKWAK